MKAILKDIIPYGLLLLINYYALPFFIEDGGTAMLVLLVIIPVIGFVCSIIYGVKHGFHLIYAGIAALLFVPSIFLYYNSTAWVYVLFYGGIAFAGNRMGLIFADRRKRKTI